MGTPIAPKIYHIVHVDRLESIISDSFLWCDAEAMYRRPPGTTIGLTEIKRRRLNRPLSSHSGLHVGECVPFNFCPRSVMLYVIYKADHPQLDYRGGQDPIVHLEADLHQTVLWADESERRWAFTLSNAGSMYFEDSCDLADLSKIDWKAIQARDWSTHKEKKQAEFLVEKSFPWKLVQRVGVNSRHTLRRVQNAVLENNHHPKLEIRSDWYY